MSHHLDSPLARQDVRLDITDLYVFRGEIGTVFILNVNNSITGADAPQGFHPEAQYAIKLDFDGDAVEELTYRFTFGVRDASGQQTIEMRPITGRDASDPAASGAILAQGITNTRIESVSGLRLWAGLTGEPFYIDPTLLKAMGLAFKQGTMVDLSTWQPGQALDLFAHTQVNAIVLEVPDEELSWRLGPERQIHVWGTTLLATDAGGWQPINRAGRPMMQPIFNPDDSEEASQYNTTLPADDRANYGERIATLVARVVASYANTTDPGAYGQIVAERLLPDMLPYRIGTPASYSFACHNGRALTDNTPEVMLSLVTNTAMPTGLTRRSVIDHITDMFPYVRLPTE